MITEATKVCGKCRIEKPLSEFYKGKQYACYCKSCQKDQSAKSYRRRRELDPLGVSAQAAANSYGLTKDEAVFFHLVPCCQACGAPLDQGDHRIDHCHELGHVRGVLCNRCNIACAGPSGAAAKRLAGCVEYLNRDVERLA